MMDQAHGWMGGGTWLWTVLIIAVTGLVAVLITRTATR